MTLKVSFSGTDKTAEEELRSKANTLVEKLAVKLDSLMSRLQKKIQGEKLAGQVLHRRSGKLINSIRIIRPAIESGKLTAGVEGAGTVAFYGKYHEFGGTFHVQEHTRRIGYNAKGEITRLLTRAKLIRAGVDNYSEGTVRAHSITFPERSFMRTSADEMRETIVTEINDAAKDALK